MFVFYRGTLLQSRCASFGRGVTLQGKMPFVLGPVQIHVGNGVFFGGNVFIDSGRLCDGNPRLVLEDRSVVGWNVEIIVNKEVVVEEDVWIAPKVRISDSNVHRREVDLRLAGVDPRPEDHRPVRICRGAWIGNCTHIMKGVTIGEGAVIGCNSVVMSDIPPFALALGNPAKIFMPGYGKPSTAKKKSQLPVNHDQPEVLPGTEPATDIRTQ